MSQIVGWGGDDKGALARCDVTVWKRCGVCVGDVSSHCHLSLCAVRERARASRKSRRKKVFGFREALRRPLNQGW